MSQSITLTPEEIDEIKRLQNNNNSLIFELGQIEIELRLTEERLESLKNMREKSYNQYASLRDQESKLVEQLNKKYGVGQVDLESGIFIPMS